jgi:hypothetical protein
VLFALTLFAGAVLLFAVQPMTGRMLLPLLGGSPAVWNTCLVFFQGMLLVGYLYSHLTTRYAGLRLQSVLHLALLALVVPALPIGASRQDPPPDATASWLLGALFVSVGLPFFAVSTTSPLLQRWYAGTRARGAADPYFLSVASNLGCLVALLAYPAIVEPHLRLSEQSNWWRWGYVIYAALVAICAGALWTSCRYSVSGDRAVPTDEDSVNREPTVPLAPVPSFPQSGNVAEPEASAKAMRAGPSAGVAFADASGSAGTRPLFVSERSMGAPLRWLILSFVPSSLLVGVTNAITTDIAPIPLLWVIPLSLYLLTFIIVFAPRIRVPLSLLGKLLPLCAVALTLTLLVGATEPLSLVLAIHLITFFVAALICHGRLAAERPPVDRLTSYYLWMSLGGVLGGAFNALAGPVLFHRLGFVEYPLALLITCTLRPVAKEHLRWRVWDVFGPLVLGAITVALVILARAERPDMWARDLAETTGLKPETLKSAICFGAPLFVAYIFVDRPIRFALGLGVLLLAAALDPGMQGRVLHLERNFLGVVKITESPDGEFTRMVHGSTVHGQQRNAPRPKYVATFTLPVGAANPLNELSILAAVDGRWDDRRRPLTYYHPTGPAGITFRFLVDGWRGPRRIGAVGLGTGAIASYARPNQDWTFFELDPAVERLARDERYFTFLRDSQAKSMRIVIGDARLRLADEPDSSFDSLVLDAFSSDAIPIHLLTAEAFSLYERKLAPNGVILIHLSNRYLDLPPVVAKIAETANPPLVVRQNDDLGVSDRDAEDGKYPSIWVIVARRPEDFGPLQRAIHGFLPASPSNSPRWTDDRADVLGAFRKVED